ncbi:hypothetical protein VIGAN_10066600 [Vigna angularis var. angularis]|uniref:Tryptophan synthase beta chain-like PALP domain-containing protein n=1 Tax=Vigna angularis var. angularis TaxID=157739 RepID=A0A0S3T2N8_PHAAN|nr:hypothetical protein VIGAN_10066600 [Vigna angularis var. angularis]
MDALRCWVGDLENKYHLTGSTVGPHPLSSMVREFQSVIGKKTRMQALEKWGGKPDVLVACVGTISNALGMFHEFVGDDNVRLIGVEGGGLGLDSGKHSSTLTKGEVGVYHGAISYLLQDEHGQIIHPHSIVASGEFVLLLDSWWVHGVVEFGASFVIVSDSVFPTPPHSSFVLL